MIQCKKNIINTRTTVFLGGICGVFTFFLLFGYKVLDVSYVEWLYNKGDLTQHYNGWQLFRNADWEFPIGLMGNIMYPDKVSVVYTDAIPIFAIFFKVLSPVLPANFQYFGIWAMLCYLLHGVLSAKLIQKYCYNYFALICGVLFFTFSPIMIQKTLYHSALSAHWLILLYIYVAINGNEHSFGYKLSSWSLLLILSSLIHMYFIPMCVIFLLFSTSYDFYKNRSKKRFIQLTALLLIPIAATLINMWLVEGVFYGEINYGEGGLGDSSANLNFLVNSMGTSRWLARLPVSEVIQYEMAGYGYLGLGGILLLLFAFIVFLTKIEKIKPYKIEIAFLILLMVSFGLLATFPDIVFNQTVLWSWKMPKIILYILGMFRALGRFVWPIWYLILYISLVLVIKNYRRFAIALIVIFYMIQMADLKDFFIAREKEVNSVNAYDECFNSELWSTFLDGYDHLYIFDYGRWAELGEIAARNHLTLSHTYIARLDPNRLQESNREVLSNISRGKADDNTLYIFGNVEINQMYFEIMSQNMNMYLLGDLYICSSNPIVELEINLQ